MKILHVISGIAARYGGPTFAVRSLCSALSRVPGLTVELATTDADGPGGRLDPRAIADLPFLVHLCRRDWSERWKFSAELYRWLRRNVRRFDVVHLHALWNFAAWAACRVARREGVPVVLSPCGMLLPYTFRRSRRFKQLYWWAVEKRNLRAVHRLHATSSAESQELQRTLPHVPTTVLPLGVDDDAWTALRQPDWLRSRCGPAVGDRPIVLFIGRLHPVKGLVDLLLPAFAQLPTDAFLVLVGGRDPHAPEHEAEVRRTIDELRLQDRVALLEAVPPRDRWALFDGAAIFVLPSVSENFGMVVSEAMARAVPVVVADTVQSCEHVRAADCGRITPRDPARLAAHLRELLQNPDLRRDYGERGADYARQHLTWDHIAREFHDVYLQLAGKAMRVCQPTA
jgi:glycosyltransferase involved in cell wall biosynthesis